LVGDGVAEENDGVPFRKIHFWVEGLESGLFLCRRGLCRERSQCG
jgi:hypothetical protein